MTERNRPTISELFEAAGYGLPDDIDEAVVWLFVERTLLHDELAEWTHPEFGEGYLIQRQGRLLDGVVNALRGDPPELTLWSHHDAPELARAAVRRITRLRKAALRYRRRTQEFDNLVLREVCDQRDEAERERDAHAEREAAAQKELLEVEERYRALDDKFCGGEAYIIHQNDGANMAAVKLRDIAENGRNHGGVFGGKELEDAAQAILRLRACVEDYRAEREAARDAVDGERKRADQLQARGVEPKCATCGGLGEVEAGIGDAGIEWWPCPRCRAVKP